MFSLIWAGINGRVNNRQAGDLRRRRAHYDVIVMIMHNEGLLQNMQEPVIEIADEAISDAYTCMCH